jgi:glycosyltransferase involved in cell wall biosynthesis
MTQSAPVSEIIVVDDCSADDSQNIVRSIFNDYKGNIQCRFFQLSHNQGPSVARNYGIKEATGDFITLIDSDDYWLPDHIKTNLEVMAQLREPSFAIVHQPLVESEMSSTQAIHKHNGARYKRFSVAYYLFIQKNCSTITLFAPASAVKLISFPESQKFAEDFRFFIKLFLIVKVRVFLAAPRTAVMGKHAWASGQGLSAKRGKMLIGVLKAIFLETIGNRYIFLLPVLLPWHLLKGARREWQLLTRKRQA